MCDHLRPTPALYLHISLLAHPLPTFGLTGSVRSQNRDSPYRTRLFVRHSQVSCVDFEVPVLLGRGGSLVFALGRTRQHFSNRPNCLEPPLCGLALWGARGLLNPPPTFFSNSRSGGSSAGATVRHHNRGGARCYRSLASGQSDDVADTTHNRTRHPAGLDRDLRPK